MMSSTIPAPMARSYGYKKNPEGLRRTPFKAMKLSAAKLPEEVDLRKFAPQRPFCQNVTQSCTGHGTSIGICVRFNYIGQPLGFIPSPKGIYDQARALQRIHENPDVVDPTTIPMVDDGAYPIDVMTGISKYGVRPLNVSEDTPGSYTDCFSDTINDEISLGDIEQSLKNIIIHEYEIISVDEQKVIDVMTALAHGFPVCLGTQVDPAFENWVYTPFGAPITAPDRTRILGGHWLVCLGYRIRNGILEFIIRNSWDYSYGDNGDCYVDAKFIKAASDVTVMDVKKAAA